MKQSRSKFFQEVIVLIQIALVIAAFLIQYFEDDVSLSAVRFGFFIQPKALSAICLAILIILQGLYFQKIQKKKTAIFFLILGSAILIVNLLYFFMN